MFSACSASRGNLIRLGLEPDYKGLVELERQHQRPLILIAGQVYLPAKPCLRAELERQVAGQAEGRRTAGLSEMRGLAGGTEARRTDGDAEQSQRTGDTEDRQSMGAVSDRRSGGSSASRKLAGEVEERRVTGGGEGRVESGSSEDRSVAGESELRLTLGAVRELACEKVNDESFRVLYHRGEIRVFWRGQITVCMGQIVRYE